MAFSGSRTTGPSAGGGEVSLEVAEDSRLGRPEEVSSLLPGSAQQSKDKARRRIVFEAVHLSEKFLAGLLILLVAVLAYCGFSHIRQQHQVAGTEPSLGRLRHSPSDRQNHRLRHSWTENTLKKLYPRSQTAVGLDNGVGRLPPLGWNSWNTLACDNVNEEAVKAAADLMIDLGLADVGYEYINVDDCWQGPRLLNGTITADPVAFPSGMKALGEYIHSKGLKFGIYSDAGHLTCAGRPGSWGHEALDAQSYAEWGVDYLKYDNCYSGDLPGPKVRYPIMRDALNATGRRIFYSMCEWGEKDPATWARTVGNSWRTTPDIMPNWTLTLDIAYKNNEWAEYAGPGGWNDPDMLEVGVPPNVNGTGLKPAEERSHFALWALMKAPLLIGADLRNISEHSLSLLRNNEVLNVNQDPLGIQGRMVYHNSEDPNLQVWGMPMEGGSLAVVLFNAGEEARPIRLHLDKMGLPHGVPFHARDLLARRDIGVLSGTFTAESVEPHDSMMLRLDPVDTHGDDDVGGHASLIGRGRRKMSPMEDDLRVL